MTKQPTRVIPIVDARQASRAVVGSGSESSRQLASLPPLSLYVHVPWCVRKCPYCDFNSHEVGPDIPETEYLAALTADLEQALPLIWGRPVHTVFLGGGTPSLLSAGALDQLLGLLRSHLIVWPDAEITLEANPGTAEAHKFKAYAASGVNRLSLGIQSFNDRHLKALGRIHDASQALAAAALAVQAFPRVNLDLMYGLPDQTAQEWAQDLARAIEFSTEHLSLYQLTIEPQTVFAKYPPPLPDEQHLGAMESTIEQTVVGAGWERYEVSAYAKPGAQCRHNLNYWTFGDYLGVGPGAHSKLSFPDRIVRQARTRSPAQWMTLALQRQGKHVAEARDLQSADLPFEFMLNALRLRRGVTMADFEQRTGLSPVHIGRQRERAIQKGLLEPDPTVLRATALGWAYLNDLQALFLD